MVRHALTTVCSVVFPGVESLLDKHYATFLCTAFTATSLLYIFILKTNFFAMMITPLASFDTNYLNRVFQVAGQMLVPVWVPVLVPLMHCDSFHRY